VDGSGQRGRPRKIVRDGGWPTTARQSIVSTSGAGSVTGSHRGVTGGRVGVGAREREQDIDRVSARSVHSRDSRGGDGLEGTGDLLLAAEVSTGRLELGVSGAQVGGDLGVRDVSPTASVRGVESTTGQAGVADHQDGQRAGEGHAGGSDGDEGGDEHETR